MIEQLWIAKLFLHDTVGDHLVVANHLIHKTDPDLIIIESAESLHLNLLQLFNVVLLYGIVLESYGSVFAKALFYVIWKAVWELIVAGDHSAQQNQS
jgi:hypothetical protein